LPDRIDTFDIHVPDYENFVANGVVVHNSGFFDPSFSGTATLELKNDGPWKMILRPGDLWVQLVLIQMAEEPERDYSVTGRYNGQTAPEGHR
jgi:deoxycytidine triphosphate deaminase